MKTLYIQVDKSESNYFVWHNDYIGKIFCVVQSDRWHEVWQISDENGNRYDFYINKSLCHKVQLNDENKNLLVSSDKIHLKDDDYID